MSVVKVIELSSSSPKSFQDAIDEGIARASRTIKGIQSAWVNEEKVMCEDGKVTEYRVNLKVSFLLEDDD